MLPLSSCLRAALVVAGMATPVCAQYQFDVITYGKVQVPDTSLGLSSGWLVLVNTGTVPIPLAAWSSYAPHYAKIDAPVGSFDLKPLAAGAATMLLPGHAIGISDPVLLSRLSPSEISGFQTAGMAQLDLAPPWPSGTTTTVHWIFQLGDAQVSGRTDIEFTSNPIGFGSNSKRTSSHPGTATVTDLLGGCGGVLTARPNSALSSPYSVARSADLPVVGNARFALDVRVSVFTPSIVVLDVAPGTFAVGGCVVRLGLTPSLLAFFTTNGIVGPLPIPNQPSLAGGHVYVQAAGVNGAELEKLTNGLDVQIGAEP